MAKIVTLKSPSAEDIYPVTDASGIRVTGNVTLQQALDGFVYADDPTSPATPTPWVTADDIDWSTIKHSAPTTTVLETIGTVTSNRSYTAPSNGFLIGKGVSWASGGQAGVFLTNGDSYMLGGIPYTEYSGNNQVAFCIPVYKGQTVYFRMSGGSSRLEEVRLVAPHSEAGV